MPISKFLHQFPHLTYSGANVFECAYLLDGFIVNVMVNKTCAKNHILNPHH